MDSEVTLERTAESDDGMVSGGESALMLMEVGVQGEVRELKDKNHRLMTGAGHWSFEAASTLRSQ